MTQTDDKILWQPSPERVALFLHAEAGEISLLVDADGPRLNMWGKDKRSRVYIKAGDSPRLSLDKPAGVAIWSAP